MTMPMNKPDTAQCEVVLVVSDIFSAIADRLENVKSETEVIEWIMKAEPLSACVILYLQQGVDAHTISRAARYYNASVQPNSAKFMVKLGYEKPRAVRRQAHKDRAENICVSTPVKLTDQDFSLDLLFSAHNEMFLDHMTGMHVQGMALTEACRQAFLVVTEEFFLKGNNKKSYFVIKHMNTRFMSFVFPLAARIDYQIVSQKNALGRHGFEVAITIWQGETQCMQMDAAFTVFEEAHISEREHELAMERVNMIVADTGSVSVEKFHTPELTVAA
jgi:A-factor biosynthesis hotdog domain